MGNTQYHIQLKGYVGGLDFDRKTVDNVLAANDKTEVNVLIDSLGGSLATGLSISAAFKNHGKVNVHFVGLNASAATIASLGAARITMDAGAMYLVHKCSMDFFEWGSLNSDQFATLIADCEKIKADLDKLDINCAQLYARRCKRKAEDLLALMKVGGWITAKEALAWGFVDEITDLDDEPAPRMTDALASAMANARMPIPNIPLAESDSNSVFARLLTALSSFFKSKSDILMDTPTQVKTYSEEEYNALNTSLAEANSRVEQLNKTVADNEARIAELEARLASEPADSSKRVVENSKPTAQESGKSEVEAYVDAFNRAKKLFDEV